MSANNNLCGKRSERLLLDVSPSAVPAGQPYSGGRRPEALHSQALRGHRASLLFWSRVTHQVGLSQWRYALCQLNERMSIFKKVARRSASLPAFWCRRSCCELTAAVWRLSAPTGAAWCRQTPRSCDRLGSKLSRTASPPPSATREMTAR